jgi:DUF1365 family protein
MHSCLYEGTVQHHRFRPVKHDFRYPVAMLYLDLDEVDDLARRGYFARDTRLAAASFLDSDYAGSPLADSVRRRVAEATGIAPSGPIRLLCQPRMFGYFFSPLNLYYCFATDGSRVETIVAEVNNIPWRERQWYVLWDGNRSGGGLRFQHEKGMHVSPFMPMTQEYRWRLGQPGERLTVGLENLDLPASATGSDTRLFTATMSLARRPLTRHWLPGVVARHGWMSANVVWGIYWQALRLWWKGCPVYGHPEETGEPTPTKLCKV